MLPLALVCLLLLLTTLFSWRLRRPGRRTLRPRRKQEDPSATARVFHPPKPPWVRKEVIRLKALMPDHGCRKIAVTFNHLHQDRRGMTVGKTYVANVLQDAQAEVLKTRRQLKHRRPRPMPRNVLWALDLTYVSDAPEKRLVLGLLDHGTRACLALHTLPTKSSIVLLRALLEVVEQFGKPKVLRTDNEAVFTSRLFRLGLWILGIRHQKTAPFAPWQNGRIERFFGTFKDRLRCRGGWSSEPEMTADLRIFRNWYNHVRPHQHLDGWTPAYACSGRKNRRRLRRRPRYVCEWKGVLTGFYFSG